ncbi:hypothetical protein BJP36_41245 [Moorena producens JHB]|uniref:Uncharacterized protein n=1 Tax=Moorena producens (strain JHB) TaxID=1454205 RepID=A0A9Q9SSG0_MOOP1|nr:hypothetical protein [Moorena producens]WAN68792.1 hypothetical protein BJP36_41245 [Moorena producens JHB]
MMRSGRLTNLGENLREIVSREHYRVSIQHSAFSYQPLANG